MFAMPLPGYMCSKVQCCATWWLLMVRCKSQQRRFVCVCLFAWTTEQEMLHNGWWWWWEARWCMCKHSCLYHTTAVYNQLCTCFFYAIPAIIEVFEHFYWRTHKLSWRQGTPVKKKRVQRSKELGTFCTQGIPKICFELFSMCFFENREHCCIVIYPTATAIQAAAGRTYGYLLRDKFCVNELT